jgi:hypothetical protein
MIFPLVCLLASLLPTSAQTLPQSQLLDDFSTLSGWKTIVSDGAALTLHISTDAAGTSMQMDFDLSGGAGYVIAEKDFAVDLPPNYQFTFDLRGETPVNNFEFKILDEHENVHWIKKLNVTYPTTWTRQRIKKRHLSFAWGPAPGKELKHVRALQFVVSVGTGGKGSIWIDNFRFEPLDENVQSGDVTVIRNTGGKTGTPKTPGAVMTAWTSRTLPDSLVMDFDYVREVGGVVIDWDSAGFAESYDVQLSEDGTLWSTAYSVRSGKPGRAYVPCGEAEGRYLKLLIRRTHRGERATIRGMEIKGPSFSTSSNTLYRTIAKDNPQGFFPKYFQDRQSYWTVLGVSGDTKEALMNEEGQVEVDRLRFSLEPFLFVGGELITWNHVTTRPSLRNGYLPIPAVTWTCKNAGELTIEAVAGGTRGHSFLGIRYSLKSTTDGFRGKLFIAIRPFQVNPPWQALNIEGGTARIDSIAHQNGVVFVDGTPVIPFEAPSGFGALEFDQGDITGFLARGDLPPVQHVKDHSGHASAALAYDVRLGRGQTKEISLAIPFHAWDGRTPPRYDSLLHASVQEWEHTLSATGIVLPAAGQSAARTLKSNLAYVLINRDGPGIQPGSRSYERSWIRDGSLTCAALLRLGRQEEAREFIDWYARGQFPSGKVPCVIDARGPDPVPEHDSHGEFIYAIRQYFLFSRDTVWLRGKFDAVVRAVRYMQSLRAERKTDVYRYGTPVQRACYGLVPESISHEGYSDVPRHSYWDCFFILRGLKDATAIAEALGEQKLGGEFAAERDDFRKDLYASMRLAMQTTGVDYIPGCVELGDFDATSTTIGLMPAGELGQIPEPQLHNTFDKYYEFFRERRAGSTFTNYTPYEARIIGSFVLLGQKKRAEELLAFLLNDRRPPAWNHWAEVVWRDPSTPKYIGDMPHTWVGSDYIRSLLTMFVYDRERDSSHVLCAGIPDQWVRDPAGVTVEGLATYHGTISYILSRKGRRVIADVSGSFEAAHHRLVIMAPLTGTLSRVTVNGRRVPVRANQEVVLDVLPSTVEFTYR